MEEKISSEKATQEKFASEKVSASETLTRLIDALKVDLEKLSKIQHDEYSKGIMTAYAECLEVIQLHDKNNKFGLDFDIEKRYEI